MSTIKGEINYLFARSCGSWNTSNQNQFSSGSSGRVRGPRNMKSMRPPSAAIFFITHFHRAGETWPPRPPWIRYCSLCIRIRFSWWMVSEGLPRLSKIRFNAGLDGVGRSSNTIHRLCMVSENPPSAPRPSKIWFWCINWFGFIAFFLRTPKFCPKTTWKEKQIYWAGVDNIIVSEHTAYSWNPRPLFGQSAHGRSGTTY